jgi:hypothetical protein
MRQLLVALLNFGRVRDRRLEFALGAIALLIGGAILILAVLPAYWD